MAADGPKLIEVTLGSAATAWCRTATSCALSGAHSSTRPVRAVFQLDRYQSGIDHSLIDLESGMVNWYLRIPLSSLILLSSDGAVFSRDPCIGLLQCSGKRKNMAGNGRKQPEKVGYGKKRDGI